MKEKLEADEYDIDKNLRSPICVVLGHVDTGKTLILDKIRKTRVQEGEAGGITQQIGATYFPIKSLQKLTNKVNKKHRYKHKLPGLLVIDTPGHETFTNLRSRGSNLCDVAILVVDIMHGIEPQTRESIDLLKKRKTPFVVALNKIDRLYDWNVTENMGFRDTFKNQKKHVQMEFQNRLNETILHFNQLGMNAELYFKNKSIKDTVSLVPTSAVTGEGIPDLLMYVVQLTQKYMIKKLTYLSTFQCTILEVKVIEGHGTTVDVILVNGKIHEGDRIITCGLNGPIDTTIRALLTPQPLKELRVKSEFIRHPVLHAAVGFKISAVGLENSIPGSEVFICGKRDDPEELKERAMKDLNSILNDVDTSGKGVYVQSSTLGSLEALLEFLKQMKIPVFGINIGPVHKKDVEKASVMLELKPEFGVVLAFDVTVTGEAREYAKEKGVQIFEAKIIYHLFDRFTEYMKEVKENKFRQFKDKLVFPVIMKILPKSCFNSKDPIILGVKICEGSLRVGTPICVSSKKNILLGKVVSIQLNKKSIQVAKVSDEVAIRIEGSHYMHGRHFEDDDTLVSHISRVSIDILKEHFQDEMTKKDWKIIIQLKKLFQIN
ncbi:eukaryotic translation initiation factor 5b [Anaeramoeba flamelloides]|nr:eukaryotic translation initiation factor 5b [Anaeramoeba flamelloides]